LVPENTVFTRDKVKGQFFIQRGDAKQIVDYETNNYLNSDKVQLVCNYPYTQYKIVDESGAVLSNGKSALLIATLHHDYWQFMDLEVLYVGQSYGSGGERTASERLRSHSTLQGIYAEAIQRSPDQDIWLILATFEEYLLCSFDGRKESYGTTLEQDSDHITSILHSNISQQQKVNFTEAALIRYFQPPYNKIYKDSFPNPAHSSYSECYDIDLNMVAVEFQSEEIMLRLYSETVEPKWIHFCNFPLHSREDRIYMFDTDYI
jgi:hypothetical protein